MSSPVFTVDGAGRVSFVNAAAESLFGASRQLLAGRPLADLMPEDSTLLDLILRIRAAGASASEYGVHLAHNRGDSAWVDVHISPLMHMEGETVIVLHPCSTARRLDRQLSYRGGARSMATMAEQLAHEIKNPLSGIRGAAQLLAGEVDEDNRALTDLIREEADRIVALIDRMEAFADGRPLKRAAVNIHQVLEHVRRIAESGFGRHIRFIERYDPSLPPVDGDRDQLIQVFLNLVKNAVEATPGARGDIVLSTQYEHGLRLSLSTTRRRLDLPIAVAIRDFGTGVPESIAGDLFDPFVTSKTQGGGLGLSLVAKIVGDHGGTVEYIAEARGSTFQVHLPAWHDDTGSQP